MEIRDMAKKFNVLRDAMSQESQRRAQVKADQMLAEIPLDEKREDRRPAKLKSQHDPITLRNITLHNIHYAYYPNRQKGHLLLLSQ